MPENLVRRVLDKFALLSETRKKIDEETSEAQKEYEDYCTSSDADLEKKTDEILKKIRHIDEFMEYAREHATDLEEAGVPFETSEGALESLRQKIALNSHNDPNAETLYTKASGQRQFFRQDIERVKNLINGSKVQAKRLYESTKADLAARKEKHDTEFKAFIASDEFKEYIKLLSNDKAAFNSPGTVQLSDSTAVSMGQRRVRLPVPAEFEQELSVSTAGEFNSAAKTIGAPYSVSFEKGSSIYIDFDARNEAYMLGGIQRFLLNMIKYRGTRLDGMTYFDPKRFNSDGLGHIAALTKGNNPFIKLPTSGEACEAGLYTFMNDHVEFAADGVNRVFVFHCFPEMYSEALCKEIFSFCENAEKYGVIVILTHLQDSSKDNEFEGKVRGCSENIRSRNGGFYIESSREALFWYSAPSDIPDEIRRTYIEQRRKVEPVPAAPTVPPTPVHTEAPVAPMPAVGAVSDDLTVDIDKERVDTANHESFVGAFTLSEDISAQSLEEDIVAPAQPIEEQPEPDAIHSEPVSLPEVTAGESTEKPSFDDTVRIPEYTKGTRRIDRIPYGNDAADNTLSLDLEGNGCVTYVCGLPRSGRAEFLYNIIDGVVEKCHPDDAELWLIDCTKIDFARYIKNTPPHVRYLVMDDSAELVRALADRLFEVTIKRGRFFSGRWSRFSEVPKDIPMPEILVVINNFTAVNRVLKNDTASAAKFRAALEAAETYGIRFVVAGETFTENGTVPEVLSGGIVKQCAALSNKDSRILALFDGMALSAEDSVSIKRIPLHSAFVRVAHDESEVLALAQIKALHSEEEFGSLCGSLRSGMIADSGFEADNVRAYIDKKPVIADRSRYKPFDNGAVPADGEKTLISLGEPCGLKQREPIAVSDAFAENIMVLMPTSARYHAAHTLLSVIKSASAQGVPSEIISADGRMMKLLSESGELGGVSVHSDIDDIIAQIKELSSEIETGKAKKRFVIILGVSRLAAELETLSGPVLDSLYAAFAKGAKLGCHFVVTARLETEAEQAGLKPGLFTHKIEFDPVDGTFIYSDGETRQAFTTFIHKGMPLDCFRVNDAGETEVFLPEDYTV